VKRIFSVLNTVVAIAAGVIVLFGYFISVSGLAEFRSLLLQWSVLLAGIAVIIGIGNLFSVHLQKITEKKPGALYSIVLLVFFMLTFVVILMANYAPEEQSFQNLMQNILLNGIMVPVEISLMALLAITLLHAAMRMLRWRIDLKTIIFLVTALLALISAGPLTAQVPWIGDIIQTLSTGGARGILIGVALGTLTTGLRILLGADRPYGSK